MSSDQEKLIEYMQKQASDFDNLVFQILQDYEYTQRQGQRTFDQRQVQCGSSICSINNQENKMTVKFNDSNLEKGLKILNKTSFQSNQLSYTSQSFSFDSIKESQEQSLDHEQSSYTCKKGAHKKIEKFRKQPYPTKNFLPFLSRILLDHLLKFYKQARDHPKMLKKKSPNIKEIENLLNVAQFKPIFDDYFNKKVIYRDMMLFGGKFKLKKIYLSKASVIEQAFRTGKFSRIN